jgi:hypothetical protein
MPRKTKILIKGGSLATDYIRHINAIKDVIEGVRIERACLFFAFDC